LRTHEQLKLWVQTGVAVSSAVLAAITLVWREWIEFLFGVDPDHGDGALEWTIVVGLAAVAVGMSILAHRTWRHASAAA
jgi:hypothetical protein